MKSLSIWYRIEGVLAIAYTVQTGGCVASIYLGSPGKEN